MNPNNCLDFEKPIAELEAMLKELRHLLQHLDALAVDELLEQRYRRLMAYGVFRETAPATSLQSSWSSSVVALLGKDSLLGKD